MLTSCYAFFLLLTIDSIVKHSNRCALAPHQRLSVLTASPRTGAISWRNSAIDDVLLSLNQAIAALWPNKVYDSPCGHEQEHVRVDKRVLSRGAHAVSLSLLYHESGRLRSAVMASAPIHLDGKA